MSCGFLISLIRQTTSATISETISITVLIFKEMKDLGVPKFQSFQTFNLKKFQNLPNLKIVMVVKKSNNSGLKVKLNYD